MSWFPNALLRSCQSGFTRLSLIAAGRHCRSSRYDLSAVRKTAYVLVFLYAHQQNLLSYLFKVSSVNRWVWSIRSISQCNIYSPTWLASAATNVSVTSTSHDASNTSLYFCPFLFISFCECRLLWGVESLVTAQVWLSMLTCITPLSIYDT